MARSAPLDSTDFYINKLAQIAPSWALWYTSMGLKIHYSEPVRAIALYEKSIDLDSSFYPALFHLKSALEINGEREKANRCREQLIRLLYKQIEKDSDQLDNNAVAYLATALVEMRRYRDASRVLNIGLKSNAGEFNYFGYVSLLKILFCTSQYEIVVDTLLRLEKQIGHQPFAVSLGIAYTHLGDYEKAKKALLSVTDQTEMPIRDLPLLNVYRKTGCFKEALDYFNSLQILGSLDYFDRSEFELMSGDTASANKSLDTFLLKHTIHYKRNQSGPNGYENRIMALYRLGRMEEMQKTIQEADQNLDGDPWHHFRMACAYAQIGEPTKAFQQLSLAEQFGWLPSDFYYVYGNFYDPYLDPLRLLPEFKVIAKNWTPPYQDTSKN
jgi:tetratricopeptide (TPR) repeat protein